MTSEHYVIAMMARLMFIVSGGSFEGARAFGCMLRNQLLAANGEKSWFEVFARETWKHSFPIIVYENPYSPIFKKILQCAEDIYMNRQPDVTNGALEVDNVPHEGQVPKLTVEGLYFY